MTPWLAGALVFYTSGAVLVVEILAGRLLAPYVGVSLETYTGVIGTVLAGIAAGTWAGGTLADRLSPRRSLGPLLVAGGGLCLASVPLVRLMGPSSVGGGSVDVVWLSAVAFFGPAAVLSAVTPTVVKLQLHDLNVTGRVVGRLSALATAGAIVGTFLAGFVLVEAVPTTTAVLVIGVSVMVVGVGLWLWLAKATRSVVTSVGMVALLGTGLVAAAGDPCDVETVYHCALVVRDEGRPAGRLLILDDLQHSYVDLADPTHLEFRYAKVFADVIEASAPSGPLNALHVGGGGFTMPRYLRSVRPGSTSVVLEIDPGVVEVARERLGLRTAPDLRVEVGDARLLLGDAPGGHDVALGDAFGGRAVPWHLTTVEFVRALHQKLRPGGLYVLNVIDHPPFRFARAEVATLARTFGHVAVIVPQALADGVEGGNVVIAASDQPIDHAAVRARVAARAGVEVVVAGTQFAGDAPVLRDDHAPVDQWLAQDRRSAARR
ncbi:MAG: fused MFS/spermidine synthase [Actinomycetota bacterium]|nr:fused MFS/spermidine synthase [Actinomycetota bacterium]